MSKAMYSAAMLEFLQVTYEECDVEETTRLFNYAFGLEKTVSQIKGALANHKILSGRTGRFDKGSRPWNTGKKGLQAGGRSAETRFKKGDKPANLKPIGHERICSKDGTILIKVAERNPYTGAATRYRPKHHVVWEQHHGPLPEGSVLRFIDGNQLNCDISNLELVSKAVHLRLNQTDYQDLPPEVKPTMKACVELEVAVFGRQKRKKAHA
ncbi:HNH endonuclease signature motif containing protein [Bowmanella dokdonensis]|uniref:HNH endonuclease n=1 Tax=Bowmanella dokdonensis TaxID=751969 RepID=A0A939IQ79_9ALTE|nr:HNH endonuclease signature motif containing protein [Bowmanella dokdonensis]MBN7824744.1 HNH endonuclease [Bowmanella dokdonensis]